MEYYVERVDAAETFISNWASREEDSWSDTRFFRFKGSDYYLIQDSVRRDANFYVNAKISSAVEIEHYYQPSSFDPGPLYDEDFRSTAQRPTYQPTIKLSGILKTTSPQASPKFTSGSFFDIAEEWVEYDEDVEEFTGQLSEDEIHDLEGSLVDVSIISGAGSFGFSFYPPSEEKAAALFIRLGDEDLKQLAAQIESDVFENIIVGWDLPKFFILKAPLEYNWRIFSGDQTPYIITSFTNSHEYDMTARIKLEKPSWHDEVQSETTEPDPMIVELLSRLKTMERSVNSIKLISIFAVAFFVFTALM